MANVFRMQCSIIFNRKGTIATLFLMFGLVFINLFINIWQYHGYNYWNMYHPMNLVLLGEYSPVGFYFMQYFPFLVIIPASFTFFNDRSSREILFIASRTSRKKYYVGTILAVFATTFTIFSFPLILEVILNCIAFPVQAMGDQSNLNLFSEVYLEHIGQYLFSELWIENKYIYTLAMIFLFGVVSGLLACLAATISLLKIIRFKIFLFVPVYALLYLLLGVEKILVCDFSTNYYFYFRMFCDAKLNENAYLMFLALLLFINILIVGIWTRKDELG